MSIARESASRLLELLRRERSSMADFLLALADFDRRRLWRELGHASLFSFLRRELALSAGAAQYRKTAAELIQRFPDVEAGLRSGRLCLSSVVEVAKVLTEENVRDVLPRFFGLSRREAEAFAVTIRPVAAAPRREVVTPLRPVRPALAGGAPGAAAGADLDQPAPRAGGGRADSLRPAETAANEPAAPPPEVIGPATERAAVVRPAETAANEPAASPPDAIAGAANEPAPTPAAIAGATDRAAVVRPAETVQPLDAASSRLHVTVSRRFLEKLQAAKDALSHACPRASAEEILEAGLDLVLAAHAKRKGLVEKPLKEPRPSSTDAVPAHVRRAVWLRAGGRCEWRLASGAVCGATARLEFDHVLPRARGGPSTIDNLRLLCRGHNDLAARRVFGDAWMDRCREARGPADPARAARGAPA